MSAETVLNFFFSVKNCVCSQEKLVERNKLGVRGNGNCQRMAMSRLILLLIVHLCLAGNGFCLL